MTTYPIYRVETKLGLQDPLMGPAPRAHNALFIATQPSGSGQILQVDGAIGDAQGMYFETKPSEKPETSEPFLRKHYIGQIQAVDFDKVVNLLMEIPAPRRQRVFDPKTMEWVPCRSDGSRYAEGEKVPPYEKCTEWTVGKAVPALEGSGLLVTRNDDDDDGDGGVLGT